MYIEITMLLLINGIIVIHQTLLESYIYIWNRNIYQDTILKIYQFISNWFVNWEFSARIMQ